MLKLRTVVNNEIRYLDLYQDEDIKFEVSFNEVQDITQKNSPFSKSFKLPGSKNNNDIFNHFYNAAASMFDFELQEKFVTVIETESGILYTGYLRLNSTTKVNNEVIYDVTFYSEVGDLVSNIKDKWISDLDLSDFVMSGWTGTTYGENQYPQSLAQTQFRPVFDPDLRTSLTASTDPSRNGLLYFPLLNRGYDYVKDITTGVPEINEYNIPRLNWGYPPTQNAYGFFDYQDPFDDDPYIINQYLSVPASYLSPSLRVREIYKKIFEENGYNISSDFMDSAYFKKIYMPLTFSNDTLFPLQTVQPQLAFSGEGATTATTVPELTSFTWKGNGNLNDLMYRFGTDNTYIDNGIDVQGYNFVNSPLYDRFSLPPGNYKFRLTYSYVTNVGVLYRFWIHYRDLSDTDYPFNNGSYNYLSGLNQEDGTLEWFSASGGTDEQDLIIEGEFNDHFSVFYARDFGLDLQTQPATADFRIVKFKFEILDGARYTGSGNTFNPALEIPKPNIKQLDFVTSINRLFNLIIVPDPENQKTLLVEPIQDWIGKGNSYDWSDKVDRSQGITVQPLSTIFNGTLDYTYKEDAANTNSSYKEKTSREFGQYILPLQTDYRDKVTSFNNIFSASVDETLSVTDEIKGFTLPGYYVSEVQNEDGSTFTTFSPYKSTPKLLFRTGCIGVPTFRDYVMRGGTNGYYDVGDVPQSWWNNNHRITTYPWGVSGLTHAMVWNKNDKFSADEYDLTKYKDLYELYYEDYVLDLTNREQRLVKCKMYLTPEEIKNLKFNERIYVDGTIYRINKISNASVISAGLCDVELVKITRDYADRGIVYYDLIACDEEVADFHTTSELHYGLYPLVGGYVKINNYCYLVQRGSYNPAYTYDTYDILSLYTDCNCNTFELDYTWYDDEPTPTPSPTPTPTPTPTPSPSPATELIYLVENCDNPSDQRIISSTNFYPAGKVIKLTSNPSLCFEVISFTTGIPVDSQNGLDYPDCFSCPR